ncbi:MAG: hypothetical protein FJ387_15945 [Verrucomicrobia bacterium]|nr:hypothetical protein [Verrucomicrobiota bacterium]
MKGITNITLNRILIALVGLGQMVGLLAQDLPKTQPKLLTIIREEVKVGRNAAHARHEAGWPAAFEKAKSPDYYLALTSVTGPNEAWYIIPSESNAAIGERMKREAADPVLSAELERLAAGDADHVQSVRAAQAIAWPDWGLGAFPDLAKARFLHITRFQVAPGQWLRFEASAKAYRAARERVNSKVGYRIYEVTSGMPALTFLAVTSVESYGEFDTSFAEHVAAIQKATPEEAALFAKQDMIVHQEAAIFRVDPKQSYVSKEVRATDPEFWNGK